jgi:hypothetical protein
MGEGRTHRPTPITFPPSPFALRKNPAILTEFKFIKYNPAKPAAIFVEFSPHFP